MKINQKLKIDKSTGKQYFELKVKFKRCSSKNLTDFNIAYIKHVIDCLNIELSKNEQ